RKLDDAELKRLSNRVHLTLSIQRASNLAPDFREADSHLNGPGASYIQALDSNWIAAYTRLNDVYGAPAATLRVQIPRDIYRQGRTSQLYFVGAMLLAALAFGGLVQVMLDKSVVSKLAALNVAVTNIAATIDASAAESKSERDEIAEPERLGESHDGIRPREPQRKAGNGRALQRFHESSAGQRFDQG